MRRAANVNGGNATRCRNETVFDHRIVGNQAVVDACERNSVTSAGDHNVVRHTDVCPVRVEGVNSLQIGWKWKSRVCLPDDPVAVDQDVLEMVHRRAGRQKACLALHRVFVVAVADVQIVVDGVVRYREIARCIVNPIIAKMINLVVLEQIPFG